MEEARFEITVDGVSIAVRYRPGFFSETDHFEFRHPEGQNKPIPISRTGYRSHFVHESFVAAADSPEAFAKAFCLAVLSSSGEPEEQPSLFG
jgi:hypothetical protein